jgi:hypothetical protein
MSALSPDQEASIARIGIMQDGFCDLAKGFAEGGATPHEVTHAIASFVALSIPLSYGGTPYLKTCVDDFFKLVSSGVEAGSRRMQQRAIQ